MNAAISYSDHAYSNHQMLMKNYMQNSTTTKGSEDGVYSSSMGYIPQRVNKEKNLTNIKKNMQLSVSTNDANFHFLNFDLRQDVTLLLSANRFFELSGNLSKSQLDEDDYKRKAKHILIRTAFIESINDRQASRYLMYQIEVQLKNKQIGLINDLLLAINNYEIKPRALVCLLRSTFRARKFLPSWQDALSYTQNKLEDTGQNSRAWLVGLTNADD